MAKVAIILIYVWVFAGELLKNFSVAKDYFGIYKRFNFCKMDTLLNIS